MRLSGDRGKHIPGEMARHCGRRPV